MDIRDYLHQKRIHVKDFASLCGYSREYMHRVKEKQLLPSTRFVRKVEEVTNGEVTRYDLLMDDEDKISKV